MTTPRVRNQVGIAAAREDWLAAVDRVDKAAEQMIGYLEALRTGLVETNRLYDQGLGLREIGAWLGLGSPGSFADHLFRHIQDLDAARQSARVATIKVLRLEGMTLEEIGRVIGVSRQRIAAMLQAPRVAKLG